MDYGEKETSSGYSPVQAPYERDADLKKLGGKKGNEVANLVVQKWVLWIYPFPVQLLIRINFECGS